MVGRVEKAEKSRLCGPLRWPIKSWTVVLRWIRARPPQDDDRVVLWEEMETSVTVARQRLRVVLLVDSAALAGYREQ